MGTSSQTSHSDSTTAPWSPAQPALNGILGGINSQLGNYAPNANENNALGQLAGNASSQQNYGNQINGMASSYLGGDPTGLLNPALAQYQQQLGGIANQNNDPTQTPGMQNVLSTIRNDIGNSVNQQFAGAGRDLSGLNQQSLARGISQGEAVPLLGQYNQNVQNQTGAAGSLYGAAGGTASALTGNQAQGTQYAALAPTYQNAPAQAQLAASAAARGLPLNNLGMLENLTVPIAGLGNQSSSSSQTQSNASPYSMIMGALSGGANGPLAGLGTATNTLGGIFKGIGGFFA
jgi:hypothetical protein